MVRTVCVRSPGAAVGRANSFAPGGAAAAWTVPSGRGTVSTERDMGWAPTDLQVLTRWCQGQPTRVHLEEVCVEGPPPPGPRDRQVVRLTGCLREADAHDVAELAAASGSVGGPADRDLCPVCADRRANPFGSTLPPRYVTPHLHRPPGTAGSGPIMPPRPVLTTLTNAPPDGDRAPTRAPAGGCAGFRLIRHRRGTALDDA